MTMNPRPSFFDRLFGHGATDAWSQKAAWETQRAAWKARHQAQRIAWKAQRDAQRAAWKANRWRYRRPFAAVWGLIWGVFWVGFALLLIVSPEFRARVMHFVLAIPQYAVHVLYTLAGRSEI